MEAEDVAAEASVRGCIRARDIEAEDEERAMDMEAAAVKRRKLEEEEVDGESRIISLPCVEFTNHGGIMPRGSAGPPETSVVVFGRNSSEEEQCRSPRSGDDDLGGASISCCSSNGSSDKEDARVEFLDLERNGAGAEAGTSTHCSSNTRSEMSLCCNRREESDGMDSAAAVTEVKACDAAESRQRNTAVNRDMTVTEAEVEEFFTAAEKDLRIKVLDSSRKYNFDFDKEEPFDGRYEWVRLKP